jgi:hypothetical protein
MPRISHTISRIHDRVRIDTIGLEVPFHPVDLSEKNVNEKDPTFIALLNALKKYGDDIMDDDASSVQERQNLLNQWSRINAEWHREIETRRAMGRSWILELLSEDDKKSLDSEVFEIRSYETKELVVADSRMNRIILAKLLPQTLEKKNQGTKVGTTVNWIYQRGAVIASAIPIEVIKHENNALGIAAKYTIKFRSVEGRYFTIARRTIAEIIDELKVMQKVHHGRLIDDCFSLLITAFGTMQKIDLDVSIESEGFYLINGRVVETGPSRTASSTSEVKDCIELLNKLASNWKTKGAFSMGIKHSVVAPFSFILKQQNNWIRWLWYYGPPNTGKNMLIIAFLAVWEKDRLPYISHFPAINSEYKFGEFLSRTTHPQFVDEAKGLRLKTSEIIREMMKIAVPSTVARAKGIGNTRSTKLTEIPALSYIYWAGNAPPPADEALNKRLDLIKMLSVDIHPRDSPEAKKYEVWFNQEKYKLAALGNFVAEYVKGMQDPEIFKMPPLELARKLLVEFYKAGGVDQGPAWIDENVEADSMEEAREDIRLKIRAYILTTINNTYQRYCKDGQPDDSMEKKVLFCARLHLVSWLHELEGTIRITNEILKDLGEIDVDLSSLDEFATYIPSFTEVSRQKPRSKSSARHCAIGTVASVVEFLSEPLRFDDDTESVMKAIVEKERDEQLVQVVVGAFREYCETTKSESAPKISFQRHLVGRKDIPDSPSGDRAIKNMIEKGYFTEDENGNLFLNGGSHGV